MAIADTEPQEYATMRLWQKAAVADLLRHATAEAATAAIARLKAKRKAAGLPEGKEATWSNSPSQVPQLPLFDGPLPSTADTNTPLAERSRARKNAATKSAASSAKPSRTGPQSRPRRKRASATTGGKKSARR
jgi:hypothetical protein